MLVQAPPLQLALSTTVTTCIAGITVLASLPTAAAPAGALLFSGPLGATLQVSAELLLCDGTFIADAVLAGYPLPSLLTWQSSQVS